MIRLFVNGVPYPQGSKTAYVRGNRAVLVDGTTKTARAGHQAWRQAVASAARDWLAANPQAPLAEPVRVTMRFVFPPVASDPYRHLHMTKPDCDKLVRSVFDALTSAGLLADDRFVAHLAAAKEYTFDNEPVGCEITVESMATVDAEVRDTRKRAAAAAKRRAKLGMTA